MSGRWSGWKARAVAALAKAAADPALPEKVRAAAAAAAARLARLDARSKLPPADVLSLAARVSAAAALVAASGRPDLGGAAAPSWEELADLVGGRELDRVGSFALWKAKTCAALARVCAELGRGEVSEALAEFASALAEQRAPKLASRGGEPGTVARKLVEAAEILLDAAELTGRRELAELAPTPEWIRAWTGCDVGAMVTHRLKRPFTVEAVREWLSERLAGEGGRTAGVALAEILRVFRVPRRSSEAVEKVLAEVGEVVAKGSGEARWRYAGSVSRQGIYRRGVTFLFERVG